MNFSIVIPASEKNKYSKKGDLSNWGDTSLLEWKISQAKKIKNIKNIYVTTKSKIIKNIALDSGVLVIGRNNKDDLKNLYKHTAKKISSDYILWLNCTFPFLSEKTINKFLNSFKKKGKKSDSAFMYFLEKEYFYKNLNPINFSFKNMIIERNKITPLKKISNGAFIFKKKSILNDDNFGSEPFFYKIDWFNSLEIKETSHLNSFNNISSFFENK